MDALSFVENMVEMKFPVSEIRGSAVTGRGIATRIGVEGMELTATDVPPGRFAWIGFTLPGTTRAIKALGEIMGVRRDGTRDTVVVRFKHVFPADRLLLSNVMQTRAAA